MRRIFCRSGWKFEAMRFRFLATEHWSTAYSMAPRGAAPAPAAQKSTEQDTTVGVTAAI